MVKPSLRKAFEAEIELNDRIKEVTSDCNSAFGSSKYQDLEIPDEVVECLDYGNAKMTFERFKEIMDEELEVEKDIGAGITLGKRKK